MHPKVNEAPPSHRLRRRHGTRLETVPNEVSVPSDGISRKGSQPPDDEAPSPTRLGLEPHLDLVPDDLPEDGHRQLDMEALERLKRWTRDGSGFDSPFPDPPLLLFTILAFSDGVNPRYRDIPQLELFLKEDPDVGQMLKEAWTDRTFKKIRNIAAFRQVSQPMAVSLQNSQPEFPNPARKDSVYPADSDTADTTQSNPNAFISDTPIAELRQYLEGLRDKVMLLFNGQRKLRVWQVQHGPYQDHVASLALPMLERLPSLLIHDLGRLKHDDQLDARIAGLFQRGSSQPIFLCNTSGSGKTRLIFEGFTRHWGMYFTSRTEPDHVGSKDLSAAVADLATKFHVITPQNHSRALPHNRSVVTQHIQAVVFARYFVFRMFLECAKATRGAIVDCHKRIWLLAQIAPLPFFGSDVFLDAASFARSLSLDELHRMRVLEMMKIGEILGAETVIYNALDEAQLLLDQYMEFLQSSQDPNIQRPVLRDTIPAIPLPLIVSGTGLSMRDLRGATKSVAAKEGLGPELFMNLGLFDDWELQRRYLEHYFPRGFLTAALADRIKYWLRGRHRFTATYLSRLIENDFVSPHRVLNHFVHGFSGFLPTDGDCFIEKHNEPPLGEMRPYNRISFAHLSNDVIERYTLSRFILDYAFTGTPRTLGAKEIEKLVEYGIGRFKGLQSTAGDGIGTVDEPLAVLTGMDYFGLQTMSLESSVLENLKTSSGSARGPAFEQFCAYTLALAFSSPTRLDSVFDFVHTTNIGEQKAQLVALQRDDNNHYNVHPVNIISRSISTYLLGSSPSSEIETLLWLKNPARTAFCFPSHTFGPDIIFILRLTDGNLIPILVQCKQHIRNSISANETAAAFMTSDPSSFISRRERDSSGKKNPQKTLSLNHPMKKQCQNALQALASGSGQTRAIRVLISYPAVPNPSTVATSAAGGNYPCAIANLDTIIKQDCGQMHDMLESLRSAAETKTQHERLKRAMRKTNADSEHDSSPPITSPSRKRAPGEQDDNPRQRKIRHIDDASPKGEPPSISPRRFARNAFRQQEGHHG